MDFHLTSSTLPPPEWSSLLNSLSINESITQIPFLLNGRYPTHVSLQQNQHRIFIECHVFDLNLIDKDCEFLVNKLCLKLNHTALTSNNLVITTDEYKALKFITHINIDDLEKIHLPALLNNLSQKAKELEYSLLTLMGGN